MNRSVWGSLLSLSIAASILVVSSIGIRGDRDPVARLAAAELSPRVANRPPALAPRTVAARSADRTAQSIADGPVEVRQLARSGVAEVLPGAGEVRDWREFLPATLTVEAVPGLPLEFAAVSVSHDGRRTTWIGENPEQGATLVACGTETLWNAIITVPGADEVAIQITPDTVRVIEHARSLAVCGDADSNLARSGAIAAAAPLALASPGAGRSAATYISDVLVLYDAATKAAIGTPEQVENTFATMIATMNTYLANSLVDNLQWRLAGVAEAPAYPTTNSLEDDLDMLADRSTTLGQFARTQRASAGADQVLLMITGSRDYAGMAHTPGYFAVAIYSQGTAVAAHELGHNFGCRHDRPTEKATDGDGRYYYAHRFTYNNRDTGTLMSYAAYYIPYYSNPAVSYQGIPTGIASTDPKAADNARWLREHAADVANLAAPRAYLAPAITTQPAPVTVTAGQPLSLSVVATGDLLSYQWYKGTLALNGATSATYSKTATTGDTGTYHVVVSNSLGSITSNTAAVTVNTAPTTTSSTGSSSGGGGGGGALGLGVALLLASLLGVRDRMRR